ncbi:hypothetical protein, partial [Geobacillus sp. T6]|uniref:hypothetical protein n=1 Tax=Geobacillus sp. T6 TaxID=1659191 RepID=UPI0019D71C4F
EPTGRLVMGSHNPPDRALLRFRFLPIVQGKPSYRSPAPKRGETARPLNGLLFAPAPKKVQASSASL